MNIRKFFVFCFFVSSLSFIILNANNNFLWQFLTPPDAFAKNRIEIGSSVDNMLSEFSMKDIDGNIVHIKKNGKPIYLNFFATWCPLCAEEIPIINKISKKFKNDIDVWGINFRDKPSKVKTFIEKYKIEFRVFLDENGEISEKKCRVTGLPMSIIIDKDRIVRYSSASPPDNKFIKNLIAQKNK